MSIESVMPSKHLILCCPLLLQPSVFPSIRIFSNESVPRSRWPKYWSSNFSISPSNEYSGLIYLRWLGGSPCCPETLKHLLQHHYTVHGLLQARILEWIAFPSSRGSSQPRSPALQADSLPAEPQGKALCVFMLLLRLPGTVMAPRTLPITLTTWWYDWKSRAERSILIFLGHLVPKVHRLWRRGKKGVDMNAALDWPVKNSSTHQTCKW